MCVERTMFLFRHSFDIFELARFYFFSIGLSITLFLPMVLLFVFYTFYFVHCICLSYPSLSSTLYHYFQRLLFLNAVVFTLSLCFFYNFSICLNIALNLMIVQERISLKQKMLEKKTNKTKHNRYKNLKDKIM